MNGSVAMSDFSTAVAAVIDATRHKSSGPSVNVHVVKSPKEIRPDFERMREQIQGAPVSVQTQETSPKFE